MKKKKTARHITVYVRNKNINPSGYYRITQYFDKFTEYNIKFRELCPDHIYRNYFFRGMAADKIIYALQILIRSLFYLISDNICLPDTVVINREICPRYQLPVHYLLEKRLLEKSSSIWDFDDAIQEMQEISKKEFDLLEKYAERIILLSNELKAKISKTNWQKVWLLTTTDGDYNYDSNDQTVRKKLFKGSIRIIWVGTENNLQHLTLLLEEFEELGKVLAGEGKKLILTCICSKNLNYSSSNFSLRNIRWSRERVLKELRFSHVGVMPLYDNKLTRGKGGFKLIQYLAAGLPVAGSDVGINRDIITDSIGKIVGNRNNWCSSIYAICSSWEKWKTYSQNARSEWESKYSYKEHYDFWKSIVDES